MFFFFTNPSFERVLLAGVGCRKSRKTLKCYINISLISCSIGLAKVFWFSLNCPISSAKCSSRSAAYFFCRLAAPVRRWGWGWMGYLSKIQMSAEYLWISIVGEIPPTHKTVSDVHDVIDNQSCVATPEFWCNSGAVLLLSSCGCALNKTISPSQASS